MLAGLEYAGGSGGGGLGFTGTGWYENLSEGRRVLTNRAVSVLRFFLMGGGALVGEGLGFN